MRKPLSQAEPATSGIATIETDVGSVFVSNYPPFSFWSADKVDEAKAALDSPPAEDAPLGLYVHIPFCRKRCKFCYFKVYTDKDSGEIPNYIDTVFLETYVYSDKSAIQGRPCTVP